VEHQLQAIVTLLALVNPAVCAAIFMRAAGTQPRRVQLTSATTAAATVLVILALAALFGARILHAFGVSLDAFSVAGGGVLAWIGFGMLRGSTSDQQRAPADAAETPSTLTPLILFAASPGTITGVITLAVTHSKLGFPVTALVAVAVATAVLWLALMAAIQLSSRRHDKQEANGADRVKQRSGFVRDTITRFMGLIVIAMGVQFALSGLQSFFDRAGGP
jgi:multiple antibiotic resistance protein